MTTEQPGRDAATATADPDAEPELERAGRDLVAREPTFALERVPAIDSIPERMLKLLEAKSPRLTHAERAQALELAIAYQLDPFANEIWFTKSRGRNGAEGKLLIMVGRDGLRKVAQRNGLELDCDVVREKDVFEVTRGPDRARAVRHDYQGSAEARGPVVGAWAECYERKTGMQRGFFYAPVSEYKPSGDSAYSPWSKQLSVMILAAAERQAVRQATPLGGLLVEGEDVLVDERGEAEPASDPLAALPEPVRGVIERARRLGHVRFSDAATAQMVVQGKPEEFVASWAQAAHHELDQMDEPEPEDADVVEDGEPEAEPVHEPESPAAPPEPGPAPAPPEDERAAEMRERAAELREMATDADDPDAADALYAEADSLETEADAVGDAAQSDLGL